MVAQKERVGFVMNINEILRGDGTGGIVVLTPKMSAALLEQFNAMTAIATILQERLNTVHTEMVCQKKLESVYADQYTKRIMALENQINEWYDHNKARNDDLEYRLHYATYGSMPDDESDYSGLTSDRYLLQ